MKKKTHAHLTLVGRFLFYRNPIQNHIQNHITQKNLETEKTWPENYVKPTLIMWLNLQGFVVFIKCSMNPLETQFNRVFLIECFKSSVFNRVFSIEWALFKFVDRQHFPLNSMIVLATFTLRKNALNLHHAVYLAALHLKFALSKWTGEKSTKMMQLPWNVLQCRP